MPYEYDVFLSHNSKDKPAVESIANALEQEYKIKCWLDKWNLVPGNPWQEALEKALDQCQTVAVFVGPNKISPWENEEMRAALEEVVNNRTRRVIPVLLPGSRDTQQLKLPRFLKRLTWVDFRAGLEDKEALYRLMCGIKGIAPGSPTVQLVLQGTSSEFNEGQRDDLEGELAAFLQVDRSSLKILNRNVELSLTDAAATRLLECFKKGDAHLKELGIVSAKLINRSVPVSSSPTPVPGKISLAMIAAVVVLTAAITLGAVALFGRWQNRANTMTLWTFDQGTQAWQPEKQSDAKPEAAALKVGPRSDGRLQGDFNFGEVDPEVVFNGTEPRATYFVPVDHDDWSTFRTLVFEAENLSSHDLKVIFSISDGNCWYEFGRDKILPLNQKLSLRFDLTEAGYKTCKLPESYENAAPPFKDVWRFDLIFLTPENPWDQVNGSVLIDNVKLTDRIPDTTK